MQWRTLAVTAVLSGSVLVLSPHAFSFGESSGPARPAASDSVSLGVFEGRTPCGREANEFTGFPATNCEKIKWELTLFVDRSSKVPAGYLYRGTRTSHRGQWSARRGAAHDPDAAVYLLHRAGGRALALLPVGEDVILVLDSDRRVLAGDASWSYTLNRTR